MKDTLYGIYGLGIMIFTWLGMQNSFYTQKSNIFVAFGEALLWPIFVGYAIYAKFAG